MLHNCALRLTENLYRHCSLEPHKRPIFVYGFELIMSTSIAMASIIFISALLNNVYSSIIFLLIFFFLRLFCGGYHAPTYARCFLLTNSVYIAVYISSLLITRWNLLFLPSILSLFSGIVIFYLAPIRNKNHPLSDNAFHKNQKIARFLVVVETFILVILSLLNVSTSYLSIPVVSLMAVAVLMIVPKIQERSE